MTRISRNLPPAAVLLALLLTFLGLSAPASAQTAVREITQVEVAFAPGVVAPEAGWRVVDASRLTLNRLSPPAEDAAMWVRFHFDRAQLPAAPLAYLGERQRSRSILWLNGNEIQRNFASDKDEVYAWSHPFLAQLPEDLLKPGDNTLLLRLDTPPGSRFAGLMSVSGVKIGALSALRSQHDWRVFIQVAAPQAISWMLAYLSGVLLLTWMCRPKEAEFGWLAAVGALWSFRNLHFFMDRAPIPLDLFWELSFASLYFLMVALYGFAGSYFKLPSRRRVVMFLLAGAVLACALMYSRVGFVGVMAACIPVAALVTFALAREAARRPTIETACMLLAIIAAVVFSVNDLLIIAGVLPDTWFYLQPFASVLVFSAFGLALGRRVVGSFAAIERMNVALEERVRETRAELAASEHERQRLIVDQALHQERERLMREMHDGIGSSLVTALAVSQRDGGSAVTSTYLRRCLTDLKLTVDSLEPIDGDVAALLASFRYRVGTDLENAGISLDWQVERVMRLARLEAVAALHVSRIVQEAISNAVIHGRPKTIRIAAHDDQREGASGVLVSIADDGAGMAMECGGGKGIASMKARARAVGGALSVKHAPVRGVEVELWLPS